MNTPPNTAVALSPTDAVNSLAATPTHIQQKNAAGEARSASAGASYMPYIRLKGHRFTPVIENVAGQTLPSPLPVVILDFQPAIGRVYYADAYSPDAEGVPPTCWSTDGVTPSAEGTPQAPSCSQCRFNVKGSGSDGKSRACSYSRRLVVLVPGYEHPFMVKLGGMSMFGKAAPGQNVFSFENYAKQLKAGAGDGVAIDPSFVWTVLSFDQNASVPVLTFSFGAGADGSVYLSAEQLQAADAMRAQYADEIAQVISGSFGSVAATVADRNVDNPAFEGRAMPQAGANTGGANTPFPVTPQSPYGTPDPAAQPPAQAAAPVQQAPVAAGVHATGPAGDVPMQQPQQGTMPMPVQQQQQQQQQGTMPMPVQQQQQQQDTAPVQQQQDTAPVQQDTAPVQQQAPAPVQQQAPASSVDDVLAQLDAAGHK